MLYPSFGPSLFCKKKDILVKTEHIDLLENRKDKVNDMYTTEEGLLF